MEVKVFLAYTLQRNRKVWLLQMKEMKKRIIAAQCCAAMLAGLLPIPTYAADDALWGKSPIDEPYPYVQSGGFTGEEQPASPDPLVRYRWDDPKASDELEIFLRTPQKAESETPENFTGMSTLMDETVHVNVTGPGTIRMDFGTEFAGWLEIDSPDLAASGSQITLGVSEYNQPSFYSGARWSTSKTKTPKRYANGSGDTYRLEINPANDYFEGARFGFINVTKFDKPFTITGVRLVCQVKPTNYESSFSCNNEMLNKIWYTAAYDVRVNFMKDYMAAILVERGDRHSWTGDAYTTQAASLVAFGNYDFVLQNMIDTEKANNNIASYELYWVLSLIDYYQYTGDGAAIIDLLDEADTRLDQAYALYDDYSKDLRFFGWDERLGAGFEYDSKKENHDSYKMLAIQTWNDFAEIMDELGENELAKKYRGYAREKTEELHADPDFYKSYAMHTIVDAINAGVLPEEAMESLAEEYFGDRVNRLSFSPFNQYFILQAMAETGHYDDALESILDMYGSQIEYGVTGLAENYKPAWNDVISQNGPIPNDQSGYTSLAHPWGAGVLSWMSEEVLGIKPTKAAFEEFTVKPHLGRQLTQVSGDMYTPKGVIEAAFDTDAGVAWLVVPEGATAVMGIPKVEKEVKSITVNGKPAVIASEDDDFLYIEGLTAGSYGFSIAYQGQTPAHVEGEISYPGTFVGKDFETKGNWGGVYGSEGYVLSAWNGADYRVLPDYVDSVAITRNTQQVWDIPADDERALANNPYNIGEHKLGANRNTIPVSFAVDINLKENREYTVALYFVDYDTPGPGGLTDGSPREVAVEMFDGETFNDVAPIQVLNNYQGGAYLIYKYDKSARFRVKVLRGANATLSGVFFGEGEPTDHMEFVDVADDRDARLVYTGAGWKKGDLDHTYYKTLSFSKTAGDSLEYKFSGNSIDYIASTESNRGIVEVFLDGKSQGEFDLYSPTIERRMKIFSATGLSDDEHTIKIVATGKKNPKSSDCYVDLDAFSTRDHIEKTYEGQIEKSKVDNSAASYHGGGWTNGEFDSAYGKSFKYSNIKGAYAEYTFKGSSISYIASKEFNRGYANIYLDGSLQDTVDLYAPKNSTKRQVEVFTKGGLDPNVEHTIKVEVSGNKNPSSTGTYIDVDAFEYDARTEAYNVDTVANSMYVHDIKADDANIKLSPVPKGYAAEIITSSHADIIATDGTVTTPKTDTEVALTVRVSKDGEEAQSTIVTTVPASLSASDVANRITKIEAPAAGEQQLTLPSVPEGYTVAIKSSSNKDIIGVDRAVNPQENKATVGLKLEVTRLSDGTTAATDMLMVKVPAKIKTEIPLTKIWISAAELTFEKSSPAKTLSVAYMPGNATDAKAVTWESSDTSVATVANGSVTPVGVGSAIITAKIAGGLQAACKVTVEDDPSGKDALAMLVRKAETMKAEGVLDEVTPAIATEFEAALEEAKAMLTAPSATDASIEAATERLNKAMKTVEEFLQSKRPVCKWTLDRDSGIVKDIPAGTDVSEMVAGFGGKEWVMVLRDGQEVAEGLAATGMIVRYKDGEQESFQVAVQGDLDGDGEAAIPDVMEACKILARRTAGMEPGALEAAAGNLDGDDTVTISDVMEICKILARRA